MRWRPLGDTYLWSEAYNVSNIVSHETRINLLRSFVCYPSHPSSDPFRCCISVDDRSLPTVSGLKKSFLSDDSAKPSIKSYKEQSNDMEMSRKQVMHLVILNSPLVLKNYLPETVSVLIENGGVTRSAVLSKVFSLTISFLLFHMPTFFTCCCSEKIIYSFSGGNFFLSY